MNTQKIYEQYVQNRLIDIRKNLPDICWKLVSSKQNPADIGSRGSSIKDLNNSKLWFEGPEFLSLPENKWPQYKAGFKFDTKQTRVDEDIVTCLSDDNDSVNLVEIVTCLSDDNA